MQGSYVTKALIGINTESMKWRPVPEAVPKQPTPPPLTESLSIIRESGIYTGPQTGLIAVLINTGTLHQYNGKLNVNADCIDTIADTKIDKSTFINIH